MTLSNPKLSDDHALLVTTNELLASALFTTAMASYELGQYGLAQEYVDRALTLQVWSIHLKVELFSAAALIYSYVADVDQQKVLFFLDRAFDACHWPHGQVDDNFFCGSRGMFYAYKAWSLSSPKMKGSTRESVSDILTDANCYVDVSSGQLRNRMIINWLWSLYYQEEDKSRAV